MFKDKELAACTSDLGLQQLRELESHNQEFMLGNISRLNCADTAYWVEMLRIEISKLESRNLRLMLTALSEIKDEIDKIKKDIESIKSEMGEQK